MANTNTFDRRAWLKTAGLAGAFSMFGGAAALANPFESSHIAADDFKDTTIRLSSNENPYGPSGRVRKAIINNFDKVCRYPYGYMQELRQMIADRHGVTPEHVVLCGGSTEGLKVTGLIYGMDRGEIVAPKPTFLAMLNYGEQFGAYVHEVPVGADMGLDLEAMAKRVNNKTGLIFVCNPNNPTGTLLPAQQMRDFCNSFSNQTMVFSDEAYFDYITEPNYPSMIELVKQDKNVIVSRTFSKVYGLAGIRIGYLVARPDIADRLNRNLMANTNVLAVFAAIEAMKDADFYKMSLAKNEEGKKLLYQTFDDLGLEYVPSHTNFVFFKTGKDIRELQGEFFMRGMQIGRPFPPFMEWCRISTGKVEEVQAFTKILREVV
jgi:histidinol-phosphate aminotransferase